MKLRIGLIATLLVGLATCALPTLGQVVAPQVQPVYNNGGSPQPVTSSSGLPVQCLSGCGGAQPSPIYTVPVQPPTPFGVTPCPGSSIAAGVCSSPAPYATAASPAPPNTLSHGYNAGGSAAPVICTHTANVNLVTTQATETLLVASASGKIIYVCSVLMSGIASAGTSSFGLYTSATNVCGSTTALLTAPAGTTVQNIPMGNGVGLITITGAGLALCFQNPGTTPSNASATIMYEQFLHSLTPEQLQQFCSIPKRCLLYGLFKHLNHLIDVSSP